MIPRPLLVFRLIYLKVCGASRTSPSDGATPATGTANLFEAGSGHLGEGHVIRALVETARRLQLLAPASVPILRACVESR
jgi:hypothetical protein